MIVTLIETIMLLSFDDESGAVRERQACPWAVEGGIVLDLVPAGRVSVDNSASRQARTPTALSRA
ncbi:GPP34 family phosphoprotein [Streptomyces sp. CA-243310]|uniref:GPP34 family phosphoprotein n=1 Tax=Streptomyces sp. CA-243310 TaxID=3240056 RepID=UPI003D8E9338